MDIKAWTYLIVGATFALYIGIAIWTKAKSTGEFYVAGKGVSPLANGMATAADWMSAASFISMAGLISFMGRDGGAFLMGWTGGYVLLALLLAPYLRKFGKFTVPDFIGDRYYSRTARLVAILCAMFVSFTYVAGQMRGVGVVFARYLDVGIEAGVLIGMAVVFFYAVLGGMKGITYTQVAQYCVLIFAFLVPAIFISIMLTGNVFPQIGMGADIKEGVEGAGRPLLEALDDLSREMGFSAYTDGSMARLDYFCLTLALMAGTAGLPHVIVRFYTVRRVKDARMSAVWAIIFIGILYTCAPAVSAFARINLLNTVNNAEYSQIPDWFKSWEDNDLIAWVDKDGDGKIRYTQGAAFVGKPNFADDEEVNAVARVEGGPRPLVNKPTSGPNELYVDKDIIVLANPEIANLPPWVVGLIAAGGMAAALSTAAGLLLVISSSFAHDFVKKTLNPDISEKSELVCARFAAAVAVVIAGYFGVNPPGFIGEVVAFAFGLAAASFFPAILLGIFYKRMNREGAVAGMIVGLVFTASYIIYFTWFGTGPADAPYKVTGDWPFFGISPKGIGTIGMLVNFVVSLIVCRFTPAPPQDVQDLVARIRRPSLDH